MTAPLPARALDTFLDRTLVLGYTKIGLNVRRALPGWPADPAPGALSGRHVLVTGASSGLGTATVEGVAALGATVHLVVRDEVKGARVRDDIASRLPGAVMRLWRCDVGDLEDVRRFAADFGSEVPALHAAVHNAGVMPPERTESAQGHELSMAVHLLGPVVMTEALRPVLTGGRVVLVSSGGMYGQPLRSDDPGFRRGDYSPTAAYARSKRMQVEVLPLLADRWSLDEITTAAMHPGWADTPGVRESLPRFRAVTRPLLRDDAQGADTSVWLSATQPAPPTALFWHDRRPRPVNLVPTTRADEAARAQAWGWLTEAAGLEHPTARTETKEH
ncbi:short-chain dehydrogenase/reductase SDR [Nocardioides sp. CF8]|uniref:SDR family NAD(P)-dependent oxidoreductase n=1 Tax=Nocardioides sp. CF8 TaxID=110319 RepID=UPI00032EEE8D|nr:SDR family NAD(P)-dependent oxidoreductase [Nocardioides sp. CF8]EON22535.1 short-chain dehydrogenase/reductase SDR [Nocardioides sp. CF8]